MSSHLIRAVIFEMRTFQAFFVNDEGCLTAVAVVVVEMAVVVAEAETNAFNGDSSFRTSGSGGSVSGGSSGGDGGRSRRIGGGGSHNHQHDLIISPYSDRCLYLWETWWWWRQ